MDTVKLKLKLEKQLLKWFENKPLDFLPGKPLAKIYKNFVYFGIHNCISKRWKKHSKINISIDLKQDTKDIWNQK